MVRGLLLTGALWAAGALVLRLTVTGAASCETPTVEELDAGIEAAARWLVANQGADGRFLYEFDRRSRTPLPRYNEVRHAGVTMSLYQLLLLRPGEYDWVRPAAERALARMLDNLYWGDGWAAIPEPDGRTLKLGATALFVAALWHRREATGDRTLDGTMLAAGRFLLQLQEADGRMLAYWSIPDDAPVPELTSRYYTGEAFWALSLLAKSFPEGPWRAAAERTAAYLATKRDEREGFAFAPWPDQWAAYGFAALGEDSLDTQAERYLQSLVQRFGFLVRFDAQRADQEWTHWLRGRPAHAAGLGTWVEGLGNLGQLRHWEEGTAERIRQRAACGAGLLLQRQVRADPSDDLTYGAWFDGGLTRMDDQQHALSALLLTRSLLAGAPR